MSKQSLLIKIKCPYCNYEYLPGEIYIPNSFVGQPKYVIREGGTGKVLEHSNGEMCLAEQYTCDKCNKTFRVFGAVKFTTCELTPKNFDQPHVTKLKKNKLFLSENT